MKNLKRNILTLVAIISTSVMFAQDAVESVFYDLHGDSIVSSAILIEDSVVKVGNNMFPVNSIVRDTVVDKDTSMMLEENSITGPPTEHFTHNVPTEFSEYIVESELEYVDGRFDWRVDTNGIKFKDGKHRDVENKASYNIILKKGSSIKYTMSNHSNQANLELTSTIKHTVDTIFFSSNPPTTGIMKNNEIDKESIEVYPNPTVNFINIKIDETMNDRITFNIISIEGKLVKQGNINNGEVQVDVSNFPVGIYFVKVYNTKGDYIITKKLFKQ